MHPPRLVLASLVLVVSMSLIAARLTAQNNNGTPPAEQTIDVTLDPGVACAFGVHILSEQGKGKTITLPGNRLIVTSPGLKAMVTNLSDLSKQVSLNVTGATHQTREPDGRTVLVFTGRNLNLDPVAGFVLAIGHFSIVFDAGGNLIQPITGKGQLMDVCAMIE